MSALEAEIYNDAALSDIASLAEEIGRAVGLDIRYESLGNADGLSAQLYRLFNTLTVADVDRLVPQQGRSYLFDEANRILFVHTEDSDLQDMMVVFDESGDASYIGMEPYDDAGRYSYRAVGNVLGVDSNFRPASFTQKFRYQDGCWRLIGSDGWWRDEAPMEQSLNMLTGHEISTFRDETVRKRTFDPQVQCLGDTFYFYDLQYHGE